MKTLQRLLIIGSIALAGVLYYLNVLSKHASNINSISGR